MRSWRSILVAGALLAPSAAWAQGMPPPCSPNPNVNAPPFVDGCPVPASTLNRLFNAFALPTNTGGWATSNGSAWGTVKPGTGLTLSGTFPNQTLAATTAGGGTINAGTQNHFAYYSNPGSDTVVSMLPNVTISQTAQGNGIELGVWNANAVYGSFIDLARGRGSQVAPTPVLAGDMLGGIYYDGISGGGGNPNGAASVLGFALENFTSTTTGSELRFLTTGKGTVTSATPLRLQQGAIIGNASTDPGLGGLIVNASLSPLPAVLVPYGLGVPGTITVQNDVGTNSAGVAAVGYTTSTLPPWIWMIRGRGSAGTPAAVQAGDALGALGYAGFGGSSTVTAAGSSIWGYATENWTNTTEGSNLVFNTTTTGTTTPVTRMVIGQGVRIGNGSVDPGQGGLIVNASSQPLPPFLTAWGAGVPGTITLQNEGANSAGIIAVGYANTSFSPWFWTLRGRGNAATPSPPLAGDAIGAVGFSGYGSANAVGAGGASMWGFALENWSGSAEGTALQFRTTTSTTTADAVRLTLYQGLTVGAGAIGTAPNDKGIGTVNALTGYYVNGVAGVTCTGAPTGAFHVSAGIVTTC